MAFSQNMNIISSGAGSVINGSKTYTGDGHQQLEIDLATNETDTLVNFELDVSQIKALMMLADNDLTVETNSASSPVDTIALLAGVPYIEVGDDTYFTKLLTTDVTSLILTNASGTKTVKFKLSVITDSTPGV